MYITGPFVLIRSKEPFGTTNNNIKTTKFYLLKKNILQSRCDILSLRIDLKKPTGTPLYKKKRIKIVILLYVNRSESPIVVPVPIMMGSHVKNLFSPQPISLPQLPGHEYREICIDTSTTMCREGSTHPIQRVKGVNSTLTILSCRHLQEN